ncbi:MAG: hypothetical protein FWC47_06430 [Oscillospiraceae bacterium]|nr:hypothetical protein [Oscillospiraceae bacterium]
MRKFVTYISILMLVFTALSCTNKNAIVDTNVEYLDSLSESLQTIAVNITNLNDFIKTSNFDDEKWVSDFKAKILEMSSSINKTTNISFPDDKQELKKSYDTVILNLNNGLDNFNLSCQTKNLDDFNNGVKFINTSIEDIKALDDKIN